MAQLFKDNKGTTAAYGRVGRGGVVILSSPWSLSNEGISKGDNLILALNAVSRGAGNGDRTVTFDEYHHGYSQGKGILSLLDTPARLGLAQIGVAFLLLVFAISRRFGAPIELKESARRRSEYLSSMSALLRRGRAAGMAQEELGRRFMEDSAVALGLPPTASMEMIVEAAARKRPDKADELRRLLSAASSSLDNYASEQSVVTLAGQWYRMRKELVKGK